MGARITTITNLKAFPALRALNLYDNSLTNIDVSENNSLEIIYLSGNLFNDEAINNLSLPNSLKILYLGRNEITSFNPTLPLPDLLTELILNDNQIVTFNPTLPLPDSLQTLDISSNQIVSFNPTNPLPDSLQYLYLNGNQMTTAGYEASEPWANSMSVIPERGSIYFGLNIDSISGTNLKTILEAKGWTVGVD